MKSDDVRILRDIEQYYSTQIDEMPMNGELFAHELSSIIYVVLSFDVQCLCSCDKLAVWIYGLVIFSPFLLAQQLVFLNQRSLNCVALTPPLSTPVPLDNCKQIHLW